ncbi:MAG: LacI family DNA-binding transcriptional regulator [Bryobacteraceae bacterium]
MATIKEVASLAGVSVGTVSHVITGSVGVSKELRQKVESAIRKLDYHPNHVARSLKTSKTQTLGIIVPDITISFYPQIIHGAETAARQRGYSLIAVNSQDDAERQRELLSLLRSQRVEGILLTVAAAPTPANQIWRMIEAGIPVVCLDRIPDGVPVDSVSVEDAAAAELGAAHLISRGYRKLALVCGPRSLKNERRRILGYRKALRRAGIQAEECWIWESTIRPDDVAALCRARLKDRGTWPDAIFSTNGPTGLGVLRAFHDGGVKTPDDIGFATFDELTIDDLFHPAVTTVVQPAYDIGYRAAEVLLQRIEEKAGGKMAGDELITIRLPATLKIRESSRARKDR